VQDRSSKDLARAVVTHPLETVLCCLLVAMVVVTFSQVVSRYMIHVSLSWSEELARFLLMWLAMLSAAYGFKTRSHFALTFIVDRFGAKPKRVIGLLVTLAVSILLVVFIVKAVELTQSVAGRIGPGTQLSFAVPYSSTIVGGVLMLYYVIQNGWREFRGEPAPSEPG
jgi:TRAP-type C4-dicarboxylate transport system permease small subunit